MLEETCLKSPNPLTNSTEHQQMVAEDTASIKVHIPTPLLALATLCLHILFGCQSLLNAVCLLAIWAVSHLKKKKKAAQTGDNLTVTHSCASASIRAVCTCRNRYRRRARLLSRLHAWSSTFLSGHRLEEELVRRWSKVECEKRTETRKGGKGEAEL